MKEIKVEFHRFENSVSGRVLSMPEELRKTGKITGDKQYKIYSNTSPCLVKGKLFLWGEKECDNNYFGWTYKTLEEAQLAISNFEKLIKKWNAENREIRGILDDAEKEYLSAVINPFKDRVRFIELRRAVSNHRFAWIHIYVKSKVPQFITGVEDFSLPIFRFGKMYKGMEVRRQYSLKELGLE